MLILFFFPFPPCFADGASVNQDYAYIYEVISISPGEQTCVDIPILDDAIYEGSEIFEVVMSALNGSMSNFSSSSTTVLILEDDTSELSFISEATCSRNVKL